LVRVPTISSRCCATATSRSIASSSTRASTITRAPPSSELDAAQRAALGREFDLITVQRKLKDAGRFVFIERSKGDASFLVFVEPTLAIVRQALDRLGDDAILADLAALLAQLVPGGRGAPG
jgi:aminoglycoside/choline kinase family phosphotransferase